MTLWEAVVSIAVFVVYLPSLCMAECNTLTALQQINSEAGVRVVEVSVMDDVLMNETVPKQMFEGGMSYVVSTKGGVDHACPGTAIQVSGSGSVDEIFVPDCDMRLFTD
ncbi:hypothetical protein NZD89_13320 [Alicyclobacillus fastidiosus]|uniref:Uncharacterized protein n=1 Tax=Alicyclobacillus fastidiosus TaxID=392011 RepID=A0ABY6ZMV3_9BACL|nr:hypothetical protein [Alicyclobacillus fastidiosus]WAH44273.1 hypothetical protein NZD89_13320 [Alicyclobacillus fastidiosus]